MLLHPKGVVTILVETSYRRLTMTKKKSRFFGKELSFEELSLEDMSLVAGGEGGSHGGGEGEDPPPFPPPRG